MKEKRPFIIYTLYVKYYNIMSPRRTEEKTYAVPMPIRRHNRFVETNFFLKKIENYWI